MNQIRLSRGDIEQQWHHLERTWQTVQMGWNDGESSRFERESWEPLLPVVHAALAEMERMAAVLDDIRIQVKCSQL